MAEDTSQDSKKGKKKEGKIDKVLMGMLIGGAIGSVLGVTLSPKSGKENRDFVKKKTLETWEKSRELLGEVVAKKKKTSWWHRVHGFLYRSKR